MATILKDPTGDLRDLPVLESLRAGRNVSQRTLGERLGVAPSQVNRCIQRLLKEGLVRVVDASVRPFAYRLTTAGEAYRRDLLRLRLETLAGSLREMKEHVRSCLREIAGRGMRRLVLYGTGEVMDVALSLALTLGLEVVGIVDDDPMKQGEGRGGMTVQSPGAIRNLDPDAILLTGFHPPGEIRERMGNGLAFSLPVLEL